MKTKSTSAAEQKESLAPELEIRVTPAWIRLIRFVQLNLHTGQLGVKIANFQPTELDEKYTRRKVRFDKEESIPTEFEPTKFEN